MEPASVITCIECSGKAHLVSSHPADSPFEAGDRVAYVCEDCNQRHDIELEDDGGEVGQYADQ